MENNDKFLTSERVEVIGEEDNSIYENSIQIGEMDSPLKSVEELNESELFGADLEDFLSIKEEINNENNIKRNLSLKIRELEINRRKRALTEEKLNELNELKRLNDSLRQRIVSYQDNCTNLYEDEKNSSSYR